MDADLKGANLGDGGPELPQFQSQEVGACQRRSGNDLVRYGQLRSGRCVAGIRTRILIVSHCEPTVLLRILDSKMANSLRFWLQSIFRLSF